MSEQTAQGAIQKVQEVVAEPAGLGLLGLGLVTLVASSEKLGWTSGVAYALPWAIFLGAFAQLMAAMYDFKRNNVFGGTAFAGYAFFWMGVGMTWMMKLGMLGPVAPAPDAHQLGFAFVGYLIFTLYMTVGAMETNKALFATFCLITLLFAGLSITTLGAGAAAEFGHQLAAWSELGVSALAFYGSAAAVLNQQLGRTVLAVGKPFGILKKASAVEEAAEPMKLKRAA